jgi:hypothetical protein
MRIYEVYTIITNFNATYRQPCAQSHLLRDPRHGCARQVATKFWTQNGEYAAEVEHGVGPCGPSLSGSHLRLVASVALFQQRESPPRGRGLSQARPALTDGSGEEPAGHTSMSILRDICHYMSILQFNCHWPSLAGIAQGFT